MPYLKYLALCFILTLIGFFPGSPRADASGVAAGERLKVFVSILPTAYFVQRIGGDRVQVETLVQPGHSPATYSPTPRQMVALASSRLYFRIGVPFENALIPRISRTFPNLTVVDLQQGIDLLAIEDHDDHDGHEHPEGDIDPHTWLDPMLALRQAALIRSSLTEADPGGSEEYMANYLELEKDLQELDHFLRETLQPYAGGTVYVFHPAYGYFCRAYNLRQEAITPGGKEPGAKYMAHLIEMADQQGVRMIFVQPQFSHKAAQTIARAINGSVVALDPLAYEYLANLKLMAGQIAQSFAKKIQ